MSATKSGIHDFLAMTDEFHPEWSVFAVEASMEQVRDALSRLQQSRAPSRNIATHLQAIEGSLDEKLQDREFANVIPIIELSHSGWIVIYWEVFYGGTTAANQAEWLSAELSTRAISLLHEDTSEVLGYALFEQGDCLEEAQCCPYDGDGIAFWQSKLRSQPELEFLDDDDFDGDDAAYDLEEGRIGNHNEGIWRNFVNAVFLDWGVYLPAFYPMNQSGAVRVEVEPTSAESIETMDLLYLK